MTTKTSDDCGGLQRGSNGLRIGFAAIGQVSEDTGGKNYVLQFLREFQAQNSDDTIVLFLSAGERTALGLTASPSLEIVELPRTGRTAFHKVFDEQILLPRVARTQKLDVLYCPGNFAPLLGSIPSVVNIRATAHYYGKQYGIGGTRRTVRKFLMPLGAKKAAAIIAPSESIRADIVRFTKIAADKITVIHHGVNTELFSPALVGSADSNNLLGNYGLVGERYILYPSALWPYKNHVRLIEAHAALQRSIPGLRLVLAGRGTGVSEHYVKTLHELTKRLGTTRLVHFVGAMQQSELRYLFASAAALVFPSCYESFGNPIMEAWASGIPVITSNVHSFPEIVGDAGLMFDPQNVAQMATAIKSVLLDDAVKCQLVERGSLRVKNFRWDTCVARTLTLLHRVKAH